MNILFQKPLSFCLLFLSVIIGGYVHAQSPPPDTPRKRLAELQALYENGHLIDTHYLKAVDSIAPLLVNNDSLKTWLSTYPQIAFGDPKLSAYKGHYYTFLALYSYNKSRYGEAIYYAERNNAEKIKAGIFEKGGIPHNEMFAVAVYYNNKDYTRVLARYDTLRPALLAMPGSIDSGTLTPEKAFIAFGVLNAAVLAAYKVGDTVRGGEGIRICGAMMEGILRQPGKFEPLMLVYDYVYCSVRYAREKYWKHYGPASLYLQGAIRDVGSETFPKHLQPSYSEELYTEAFDFYFDQGKRDSARQYLDLVRKLHEGPVKYSTLDPTFLLESDSKLLAGEGHYEAAYNALRKVYNIRDSSFYAVTTDRDNNVYALAEAEDTRNELIRTEAKRQQVEKVNFLLILFCTLLVVGAFAGFLTYRGRQRQRMLNLQLGLARNFHDEIGPMLLYANTLAKKELEEKPSPRVEELKNHVAYIMEAVRGISHDLKSNELSTVERLYEDVTVSLGKIKASTGMESTIKMNEGGRVLGHLQYINLRKILDELISNSIKHAHCTMINLNIKVDGRRLLIVYSDNGKGMAPEALAGGIGMQNMQERTNLLNGDFQLHNAYPKGYFIDITIPLL